MIISHAYKYVFLRTRKTASTSSALYLMQNLFEDGDVSIRDFRPEFNHPVPNLYDDSTTQYTLKYILENRIVDPSEYTIYSTFRNPYERIISRAFYKGKVNNIFMAQRVLSKGYVDEIDRDYPQTAYMVHNDEIKVNILNYNNIETELKGILSKHGKQEKHHLQHMKSGIRPKWATVQAIITPAIKEKVDSVFSDDVDLWNTLRHEFEIRPIS